MFSDLALARRLERAEGLANVESVAARARLAPGRGAAWIEAGGALAMFDGIDSPLTQTFGLGMFAPARPDDLAVIEAFYAERDAPVFHEVSPLADPLLLGLLTDRGYRPLEFTSVLYRPIQEPEEVAPDVVPAGGIGGDERGVCVSVIDATEHDAWTRTAAAGWGEFPELAEFMKDIGQVTVARANTYCFLATLDAEPIATGALSLHDGVALLAGASTVPSGRRRGAQLALLDARLRFAAERGCDLAMMGAAPGSASQRNAERHGFRIAYTRLKWMRAPARREG
jgi:hypothetical protein